MGEKGPEGSPIPSSFNCHRDIPIQRFNSQFCLIDYHIPALVPIESLVNFRFTATEVKRLYWSFKSECPSGMVNQESFHAIYSKFFPVGGIDIDRFSCKIKSPSFVHSIQPTLAAILIISSLRWITGRAESSILKWLFRHAHLPIHILNYWLLKDFAIGLSILLKGSDEDKLKWIFHLYDVNKDGVLTMDEFREVVISVSI